VGVDFSSHVAVRGALNDPRAPAVLLFPGEAARDLSLEPPDGPVTLVVIDGTWWQASKIVKTNPELRQLPRYALNPSEPSRYRIRREPARHCVSTIEAIVLALELIERGKTPLRSALGAFDALVEQQLRFAERAQRRHLKKKRTPRVPSPVAFLRQRAADLIVGYGEANAWPRGTPLGATPEIVHWAAERLSTGERFEAFVSPRMPLAPAFSHHTGLPPERLLNAEPFRVFAERWSAFVRDTDVLCGWGLFSVTLLQQRGLIIPECVDVRRAARQLLRKSPGEVGQCAEALGEPHHDAWISGRTGVRLAGLKRVTRALVRP
jgi:hypothetical protein